MLIKYFRYETKENVLRVYPIVCMHIGAAQSDEEFIKEHVARVKADPHGVAIYMGDGGECATKHSKGDVYSQTMSPTEQLKQVVKLLTPIKNNLLFVLDGNHGLRTYKETGLSWDEMLALALGVPYLGTAAFWHLKVNRSVYTIYTHHGIDSGVGLATKINKAKALESLVLADAVFSAHSHICCDTPPTTRTYLDANANEPIRYLTTYGYVCGCAYDSRTGYAEWKGYPPILPAYLAVEFSGKIVQGEAQKKQSSMIWRKEA